MAPSAAARPAPTIRSGHEPLGHAVSLAGHDLAARLRELSATAGSLEDALEPMLRAIVEATGASAGALCLYDLRQQALCLAAEVGLSDEGSRKLHTIARRGEGDSWGIPLHGMLNRRCYLIEHAARNRFVPALITDADQIETVACLPVYGGDTPLASLILVTRAPRTLGERELHGVEGPVHEVARSIETWRLQALPRGSATATPPSPPAAGVGASAGNATAVSSPGPTSTGAEPAGDSGHSAEPAGLAAELARAEREREQVAAELERVRREAQAGSEAHAGELGRLHERLGAAEAAATHEQRAREELELRLDAEISAGRTERDEAIAAARAAEHARTAALTEMAELRIELECRRRSVQAEGPSVPAPADEQSAPPPVAGRAPLADATTQLYDARALAWDLAARLVETEAALDAARDASDGQIASLTMQLRALREELAVLRAKSVRAARVHARATARQRISDLSDVVRDLEKCANVIDSIRLPGAEPLREAAARFADVASRIDGEYGRV